MKAKLKMGVASAVVAAATAVGVGVAAQVDASGWKARATLRVADGTEIGQVTFHGKRNDTAVRVKLDHLPANWATDAFHGFHIHANNPGPGAGCVADHRQAPNLWFVSAGGHWKTEGQDHAGHHGDMPSVLVNADGSAEMEFVTGRFERSAIVGRAVIVHAGADNFGNVPVGAEANQYTANSEAATTATKNTGNAGDRLACGVIERRR
ncbi:MAG TPA: superoxide dismutase family protein [Acidimicrobiales bacterium]|nr:superoxide dismutase family protein [Acidimicrobiales bacterium]